LGLVTRHASWFDLTVAPEPTHEAEMPSNGATNDEGEEVTELLSLRDVVQVIKISPNPKTSALPSALPREPLQSTNFQPSFRLSPPIAAPRPLPRAKVAAAPQPPPPLPIARVFTPPPKPLERISPLPPPPPPAIDGSSFVRQTRQAIANRVPPFAPPPPSITVDDEPAPAPAPVIAQASVRSSVHSEFDRPPTRRPWLIPVLAMGGAVCAFYILRGVGETSVGETSDHANIANVAIAASTPSPASPEQNANPISSAIAPITLPTQDTPPQVADAAPRTAASGTALPANDVPRAAAAKEKPETPSYSLPELLDRARAARKAGDLSRARDLYKRTLAAYPGNAEAYTGLGDIARQEGNLALAKTEYEKAVSTAPKYKPALLGVADAEWDLGEREAAQKHYAAILELSAATAPERVRTRAGNAENGAESGEPGNVAAEADEVPQTTQAPSMQSIPVEDASSD